MEEKRGLKMFNGVFLLSLVKKASSYYVTHIIQDGYQLKNQHQTISLKNPNRSSTSRSRYYI